MKRLAMLGRPSPRRVSRLGNETMLPGIIVLNRSAISGTRWRDLFFGFVVSPGVMSVFGPAFMALPLPMLLVVLWLTPVAGNVAVTAAAGVCYLRGHHQAAL